MRKAGGFVTLRGAVAVHIKVRSVRGTSEEGLGLRIVQVRLLPGVAPGQPAVPTDARVGPRGIGGKRFPVVVGGAHDDLQLVGRFADRQVALVQKYPRGGGLGDVGLELPLQQARAAEDELVA